MHFLKQFVKTRFINSRRYNLRIDAAGLEQAVFQTVKKQLELVLPMDSNS